MLRDVLPHEGSRNDRLPVLTCRQICLLALRFEPEADFWNLEAYPEA